MGNPDLYFIIIYEQGRYASVVFGRNYTTQMEALKLALADFEQWTTAMLSHCENPEQLNYTIQEIVCS